MSGKERGWTLEDLSLKPIFVEQQQWDMFFQLESI